VLHKQTQGSPPPSVEFLLFSSWEVEFLLLCSSDVLFEEEELELELELELLELLEELFEELELCFFSYSSRSSLRFLHSEFSDLPF